MNRCYSQFMFRGLGFLCFGLLLFSGCAKDSHEQVAREYLDVMGKLVKTCESLSDSKSAEKSKEEIEEFLVQLKELKTRSEDLGDADESTRISIEKKYETEFKSLSKKFSETFDKIEKQEEVAKVLESEFKTLSNLVNAKPMKVK